MPEACLDARSVDVGTRARILNHISKHGQDTSFTEFFWKGCEPHPYELERYPLYAQVLALVSAGSSIDMTARVTGVNPHSVRTWTRFEQMPKLAHYLCSYLRLGRPREGWTWLSVNNSSGHAIPLGPVVQVPRMISNWEEVAEVLAQLKPLEPLPVGLSREFLFGFLVGMLIGDSAKSRSKNWHRHVGLVLSMGYDTNKRIGDLTCICARSLGWRMHPTKDQPKPSHKPHGFYQWVSQASPLVDWIFNVVLGLKDGEVTTYDPVKMDWALSAPEDFRRGLIQGTAESDGSVSIASQAVEFWIEPSRDFFMELLLTFGVKSFKNRQALTVTRSQVPRLGDVPAFSPLLKTARYARFQKLLDARHIDRGKRVPAEIRDFMLNNPESLPVPEVSERVLDQFGVLLSFETVQRWARKARMELDLAAVFLKAQKRPA